MISLSICEQNHKYCENKVTKYPSVANLVCVPVTSAPVERGFSHGGMVVRSHRSSFAPQRLHKILFLKCNEHVFNATELL